MVEILGPNENYPVPFEQSTMWNNAEIKWIHHGKTGVQAKDLAVDLASAGYYRYSLLAFVYTLNQHTGELISAWKMSQKYMYLMCIWRGCTSGGVYVPCIYTYAGWEFPQATQVFVVVLVWRLSNMCWFCMSTLGLIPFQTSGGITPHGWWSRTLLCVCIYIYIYMFSSMLLPTTVCWDVPNINLCNQFSTLSPVSCSLYSIFSNSHSWLCQFSLLLIYLCRKISLFSCRKQVVTVQHCPIFIVVGF